MNLNLFISKIKPIKEQKSVDKEWDLWINNMRKTVLILTQLTIFLNESEKIVLPKNHQKRNFTAFIDGYTFLQGLI